jgi:hypothetical protein
VSARCALIAALAAACTSPSPRPAAVADRADGRGHEAVVAYEGTIAVEGHFRAPGEVRTQSVAWRIHTDGVGRHRLDASTWDGDRADAVVATTWLTAGALVERTGDGAPRSLAGDEAIDARISIEWCLPATLLAGSDVAGGDMTSSVDDDGVLRRVTRAVAHPRLGDVTDEARYGTYVVHDGLRVPTAIHIVRHGSDATWRVDLRLVEARRADDAAALSPPLAPPAPPAPAEAITVTRLADHVWSLAVDDVDTRSVVVELADQVAVVDAPLSARVGERIVDVVAARFPGKPIRHAFFSHYHPHYTGGLRAMVAAGATIVGGPAGTRWVEHLARLPFRRAPDRLALSGVAPTVHAFTERFVLEDATSRLEAIDIGAESEHTDEYVVFYLPRARLLVQGDLGWYRTKDGTLRASRRARALLAAIAKRGLAVDTIAQSWPVHGVPATLSLVELHALAAR